MLSFTKNLIPWFAHMAKTLKRMKEDPGKFEFTQYYFDETKKTCCVDGIIAFLCPSELQLLFVS